jgi:3-methyladenine DNA glycosylase Mpg
LLPCINFDKALIKNRKLSDAKNPTQLLSGPGKLTQALGISLSENGSNFFQPNFKIVDIGVLTYI